MKKVFYKYHGTGNDFIIFDNRLGDIDLNKSTIEHLCDRHFGIGADGLMYFEKHSEYDFGMRYFNSDGIETTMCGNGGRCLVSFAKSLDLISEKTQFHAIDGLHYATLNNDNTISLKMVDVKDIQIIENNFLLNTGVPHYVVFEKNIADFDVFNKGREIRNKSIFSPDGSNINFVELLNDELFVRTYERGVENETLSCGTGVTASAISTSLKTGTDKNSWNIKTLGGKLNVRFKKVSNNHFTDIWLTGPAEFVFKGEIDI
ncbi:MAG: diaminopimelate epimerase [Bacteroidetes bacterium GWA2_31_9b]|nr:MAG: diaminopimelate epimerase [Bacteroidetes bacterium GWA2_31_9b]